MAKRPAKLVRQMAARGWTERQILEAIEHGQSFPVVNRETGTNATRYIHPQSGRSVVVDDTSGEVLHVGGDGFLY